MPKKKKAKKRRKALKKKRVLARERFPRGDHAYRVGHKATHTIIAEIGKKKADEDDDDPESGRYAGPRVL